MAGSSKERKENGGKENEDRKKTKQKEKQRTCPDNVHINSLCFSVHIHFLRYSYSSLWIPNKSTTFFISLWNVFAFAKESLVCNNICERAL